MTIPCRPSGLLQMSSVKSHWDHIGKMNPTTPFTSCSRALEANVHCLLQRAVCSTNPLHKQEKLRNWHVTGMVTSSWRGRVLTGQINPTNSGNIHVLKPFIYFFVHFTASYLLSSSSFLISSDTLLLSSSPKIWLLEHLNPCIPLWSAHHLPESSTLKYGAQLSPISQTYFHLLLWASFIFTQSIVLQFSLSLSAWFLKLLYYITL